MQGAKHRTGQDLPATYYLPVQLAKVELGGGNLKRTTIGLRTGSYLLLPTHTNKLHVALRSGTQQALSVRSQLYRKLY